MLTRCRYCLVSGQKRELDDSPRRSARQTPKSLVCQDVKRPLLLARLPTGSYDLPERDRGKPLAREQRRLAAIMAVDVVGYSRLMGRDESGTLARLKAHRAPTVTVWSRWALTVTAVSRSAGCSAGERS